jgi:hypothetical protein
VNNARYIERPVGIDREIFAGPDIQVSRSGSIQTREREQRADAPFVLSRFGCILRIAPVTSLMCVGQD